MKSIIFLTLITLSVTVVSCSDNKQESDNQADQSIQQPSEDLNGGDLRTAAFNGDLQTVIEAIGEGVPVDETDELGRSALMFASYNGHSEVVQFLLDEGAGVNLANDEGRTPLMFAASGPFLETVSLLLEHGAAVNDADSVEGWTPLMYAAAEGNLAVVEELLNQGADVSAEDDDGETAIDFASNNGHTETAELLQNSL